MDRKVFLSREDFIKQNDDLDTNILYGEDLSVLTEETKIGNKKINNRLACQAMEGCDGKGNGSPAELTVRRYDRLSKGGAGIIWFEATACTEKGRANPRQLWIHDNNVDDFKRIVERIKENGIKENGYEPVIFMQATHSGRYSKPNGVPEPLIAYNNPIFEKDNPIDKSRILSDDDIDVIKEEMVESVKLAEKAGFDGVDIKCCHRYLNSELLSAYERDGKYGGSLENRTRFLRETVNAAIDVTDKEFLVSTRLNVYDGFAYPYGFGVSEDGSLDFDISEPAWLLKELYNMGVKIVNLTMGNPYFNPHVNRPFAQGGYVADEHPLTGVSRILNGISKLKKEVPQLKIISSGLSYLGVASPFVAAKYIEKGCFDYAGFGRMIFAYPDFAKNILKNGELDKNKICICCSKCTEIMRGGETPGCVIRDKVYTDIYKDFKIKQV